MSPTNFSLDFDNLFQTTSAHKFGAEEPEAVDEEFAALLNSLMTVYQPVNTNQEQNVEDLTQFKGEKFELVSVFEDEKSATAQTLNIGEKSLESISKPENIVKSVDFKSLTIIEPTQIKLPEITAFIKTTFQANLAATEKPAVEMPNKTAVEPPQTQKSEITEPPLANDDKLPFPVWIHDGESDAKNLQDSKKIVVDGERKTEKNYKGEKQHFDSKEKKIPIAFIPFDEIAETPKSKTAANFQAVLENFNESNENFAPSLKKIKFESISTGFHEHAAPQAEILIERQIIKETSQNTFEKFVEKVPEQIIEPMIVLAKETGKANEPRTVKIKLNPEELGAVEISLEGNLSGKLHAELKAETKLAETALNQNIAELQKALESSGWQIETLTVSCQTQNYSNSGQSEKQPPQAETQYKNASYTTESETDSAETDDRLLSVRA